MNVAFPNVDWRRARLEADRLSEGYTKPPIPVLEIAERNGVNVIFADFGKNADTVAGFCDFRKAKLYVNKEDQTTRQTFTIAHELGHWVLHKNLFLENPEEYPVLPRFQSVDRQLPVEKEANHFAANLLVPDRLLKPVKDSPISALARAFGVSRAMMEFRLKNAR